jgi:hypothetical protein
MQNQNGFDCEPLGAKIFSVGELWQILLQAKAKNAPS